MLHRFLFACVLLVLAGFPGSVAAQNGTYDLYWVALCGPDAFNPNTNAGTVQRGELRIIVEQMTDGTSTFWSARNASTGEGVWDYAVDGDFGGPGGTYRPGQGIDKPSPTVRARADVSMPTPVRATMTGFTGSRQYVLLVDGVQRQTGTTAPTPSRCASRRAPRRSPPASR